MLGEPHRNPGAIRLLQCKNKAAVTVWEILMHDFQVAIELDRFALSRLQLCRNGWVVGEIAILWIVSEDECAAKQHRGQRDEEATNDPRGTDLSAHLGTFL
jgi:hypothetical protein